MPNGEFKEVKLSDYRGKYVVLFFYPLDFTFVCPSEIIAFDNKIGEFKERGTEVLGVSGSRVQMPSRRSPCMQWSISAR